MEPVPLALGSRSLSHWATSGVLCHFMEGTWAPKDSVLNAFPWSFFGAEASNLFPQKKLIFFMLYIQPLKGLGFKVRHTGSQACLHNWAPRTLWTPEAGWVCLVVSTVCVPSHTIAETSKHCPHSWGGAANHLLTTLLGPGLCLLLWPTLIWILLL